MPKNIDAIREKFSSQIDELVALIEQKYKKPTPATKERSSSFTVALNEFNLSVAFMDAVSPLRSIQRLAEENLLSINPEPLDLNKLNASKPSLLKRLFSDESQLQANDFPESQQASYNFISTVRSFLRIFDYMLSFVTNYRILNQNFKLPKTTMELEIELKWDNIDASIHEYNDALNALKNDKSEKYTSTSFKGELDHKLIKQLPQNTLHTILSYLESTQLIEITHNHALSRYFETRASLDEVLPALIGKGFKESVFIYINPLILFSNTTLQSALKQVLDEGFHVSLFKTMSPERLLLTPRFDVPNMPEVEEGADVDFNTQTWWSSNNNDYIDYLTPEIFPEHHRVIRGKDASQRPFISVLNSKNNVVTFFQRYTNDKHNWIVGTNHYANELSVLTSGHLNLERTKQEIEHMGYHVYGANQTINYSFAKYQEWMTLFLGYMNASCPQQDGQPCNLKMLTSLTISLNDIKNDQYRFVDRAKYPDLALPHDRVSGLG